MIQQMQPYAIAPLVEGKNALPLAVIAHDLFREISKYESELDLPL